MRFLHCADAHLGGANADERLRAFLRMLDFCTQSGVQVLLIAGDLFDAPKADARLAEQVFARLGACRELSVLIAAGNHDPLCAGGNYDTKLPENVYVFPEDWRCVRIEELNLRVYGASFGTDHALPFRPQGYTSGADGKIALGVLHGDLVSANAHSDYRAITESAIAQTGLDYLALGHIHKRSDVKRAGRTYYAYSGCMQGAGFDETGEMGAYLGQIDEDGLEISFVRLSGSAYLEETLDVTDLADIERIAQACAECIGQHPHDHIRITLRGEAQCPIDAEALERLLHDAAAEVRIEDETRPAPDYATLAEESTLRGAFVRKMLEKIESKEAAQQDAAVERLALRCGLAAFEGEVNALVH